MSMRIFLYRHVMKMLTFLKQDILLYVTIQDTLRVSSGILRDISLETCDGCYDPKVLGRDNFIGIRA